MPFSGAWILFAPPEVGAFVGPIALAGYAIGSALPFIVLGLCGLCGLCGPSIRRHLPQGRSASSMAASALGLFGIVALGNCVASHFTADDTAVNA